MWLDWPIRYLKCKMIVTNVFEIHFTLKNVTKCIWELHTLFLCACITRLVCMDFLSRFQLEVARCERTGIPIKEQYIHTHIFLWTFTCVKWLILLTLIRYISLFEICCCTSNCPSWCTSKLCAGLYFSSDTKSALLMMLPWVNLWHGVVAAQLTFSGGWGVSELAKI